MHHDDPSVVVSKDYSSYLTFTPSKNNKQGDTMKKVNQFISLCILCFIWGSVFVMCKSENTNKLSTLDSGPIINAGLILEEDELLQKTADAFIGDPESAYRIALHFRLGPSVRNLDKSSEWFTLAIENGHLEARFGLARMMLTIGNEDMHIRGLFWIYTMVKDGYRIESTEAWLNRLGHTLDTAQPPDDSHFPDSYAQLFETGLDECRIGALQGNKKAALLLGKYYSDIMADNELSKYWYRIGAQNGSPECMYELGQILLGKDDQNRQIRGSFWLGREAIMATGTRGSRMMPGWEQLECVREQQLGQD
jgi:TPR repeat protein